MANFKQGKIQFGFLSTATSGGTLVLTASSKQIQILTGTSAHTVQLPDATTTSNGSGISFTIINTSTGLITVNDAGSNLIQTVAAGSSIDLLLTSHATANGTWRIGNFSASSSGGSGAGASGVTLKTSNYSVVTGDNGKVINVDSTSGAINITLPAPTANFLVTIKDVYGQAAINNIIVVCNGSETINGFNSDIISVAYSAATYASDGTNWTKMSEFSGLSPNTSYPRGLFAGGTGPSNVIDYITITTTGNATSFGTLTAARQDVAACSSSTRGVFGGGGGNGSPTNVMDYVTISTIANSVSFGNLTVARNIPAGLSSSTRGVFGGGYTGGYNGTIDYITIATTGNATSFGTLSVVRGYAAGLASTVRGVFAGGNTGSVSAIIDYITIATTGNATSFGNLSTARTSVAGCSNSTRGLIGGGDSAGTPLNSIDYITIATTGNGASFGTLTVIKEELGACASTVRGVFGGGYTTAFATSAIVDYVTIGSLGNATSFGNLTTARAGNSGCSNAHGGL